MRFEGTEKKIELAILESVGSLRNFDVTWWENIVEKSKSKILSSIQNDHCTAYLLSESSLFVYDDFLTMITCGNTSLIDAVLEILKRIPKEQIPLFFYERKNPIFPTDQSTNFYEDIKKLQCHFDGAAYRFGDLTEHHICLFHKKNQKPQPDIQDTTLEILMHEIDESIQHIFCSDKNKVNIQALGIYNLFPQDFQIDEYFFQPSGYSMNGIWQNEYYTFHITPNQQGSYVSFETNHKFTDDYQKTIEKIVSIFQPQLFDVFQFQIPHIPQVNPLYYPKHKVRKKLQIGYDVQFYNFYKKQDNFVEPYIIT